MSDREIEKLRRFLDEATRPKYDLLHEGRLYRFVSDDPLEERLVEVSLQTGALQ